jgi:hypothetical protein
MTNGRERPGVVTISKHEPLPPLRADVRTVAWWLVVGFTVGGVVGGLVEGVGGRGLMFALPGSLAAPLSLVGGALTVALGRVAAFRRQPGRPLPRMLALGLVAALIVVGSADITQDATELL